MGQIINAIGNEMRKGTKFEDWKESDGILEGYSCIFRQVDQGFYPDYLGYAMANVHQAQPDECDLGRVLSIQEERVVQNDWTVRWKGGP